MHHGAQVAQLAAGEHPVEDCPGQQWWGGAGQEVKWWAGAGQEQQQLPAAVEGRRGRGGSSSSGRRQTSGTRLAGVGHAAGPGLQPTLCRQPDRVHVGLSVKLQYV